LYLPLSLFFRQGRRTAKPWSEDRLEWRRPPARRWFTTSTIPGGGGVWPVRDGLWAGTDGPRTAEPPGFAGRPAHRDGTTGPAGPPCTRDRKVSASHPTQHGRSSTTSRTWGRRHACERLGASDVPGHEIVLGPGQCGAYTGIPGLGNRTSSCAISHLNVNAGGTSTPCCLITKQPHHDAGDSGAPKLGGTRPG